MIKIFCAFLLFFGGGSAFAADSSPLLLVPAIGNITSHYGYRDGRVHYGMDIALPFGAPITAASSGIVVRANFSADYGNVVVIRHGYRFETLYAHCSMLLVTEGEKIAAGQLIAGAGSSGKANGNHLHFEVLINGVSHDPAKFILYR